MLIGINGAPLAIVYIHNIPKVIEEYSIYKLEKKF
jgi:hypothetical protein